MSFPSYDVSTAIAALPAWAMAIILAAHVAAGVGCGVLYFRNLAWWTRRLAGDGRVATTIALTGGRFAVLGGLLMLASLEGALPLLTMALGVAIGRTIVMWPATRALP